MSGQLAPFGAAALANHAGGAATTLVQSGTPTQWIPGQAWYNTGASALMGYLGTVPYNSGSWVATSGIFQYVALLTATPFAVSTQSGNPAIYPSDITPIEVTTSGYARQPVTFSPVGVVGSAAAPYPAPVSNASAITFGPFTANMAAAAQWAVLIASNVASGSVGVLKYYWTLSVPQQVMTSQSIVIPAGQLVLDES